MKHVNLNTQDESVKQFVLSLAVDPGGSVLELDGHAVAFVVPPPRANGGARSDEEWTDAKNNRRCDLIDRKYAGGLTPAETVDLEQLQEEMLRYRQQVAPLPLEDARKLHQELLSLASRRKPKA